MTDHADLHQAFTDQFSDYYDGELEGAPREALEAHLADCVECRDAYASFKASLDGLHKLGFNFAPDDFVEQVTTSINRQSRGAFFSDSWLFGFRIPYEVFAVVLLALIAALYVFGPGNPQPLEVTDLTSDTTPPPERDVLSGRPPLVPSAEQVTIALPPTADLGALARTLRADGFLPRPRLDDGGEVLVVSVPPGQLARFAQRLSALVDANTTDLLRLAAEPERATVDVRLVRPAVPRP